MKHISSKSPTCTVYKCEHDNGTWPCEYVQLTFCKVTLVVHTSDLRIVANVMERAKVVIENRENDGKIVSLGKGNKNKILPISNEKKFLPFLN